MICDPTKHNISLAGRLIREGGVVAFPTETVYGLGADATNAGAVRKIFEIKGRPSNDPLIVHIPSVDRIDLVADLRDAELVSMLNKVLKFWPGPLSLILPKNNVIPDIVTSGLPTVAVRIPRHPIALAFLSECDRPIAAPSANPFAYVSPTTAKHVEDQLGTRIEIILNGGECEIGIESTILNLATRTPRILRPGAVTLEQLQSIFPDVEVELRVNPNDPAAVSPGQFVRHYSPRTRTIIYGEGEIPATQKVGVIAFSKESALLKTVQTTSVMILSDSGSLDDVAHNLFSALRTMDTDGERLDLIVVDSCESAGIGRAIMDRVRKACAKG